ncbi:nucleotidyltransferase domain-containing protein [Candidatus Woesearchaeota archaeon]|nr:nucleotidyltransferase domain-containing protein [Candidatus Woesearchaeota archaeon]
MKNQDVIIIKTLLEHKEQELSIASLSTLTHKDYKTTHTIVKRLEKNKLLTLQQFGKSYKVVLHYFAHPLIFEAEYLRRKEILQNKNLRVMQDYFRKELKTALYVLLLFGSYTTKTSTKHSDIDLFFIAPDSDTEFEKKVVRIAHLIPLPLHVNVFTEREFVAMKTSKENTVGSEVIKKNIILYGTEAYYELLQ